jgi:hypothetical protein
MGARPDKPDSHLIAPVISERSPLKPLNFAALYTCSTLFGDGTIYNGSSISAAMGLNQGNSGRALVGFENTLFVYAGGVFKDNDGNVIPEPTYRQFMLGTVKVGTTIVDHYYHLITSWNHSDSGVATTLEEAVKVADDDFPIKTVGPNGSVNTMRMTLKGDAKATIRCVYLGSSDLFQASNPPHISSWIYVYPESRI